MVKVAICDDEIHTTSFIENLIMDLSQQIKIQVEIDVFFDGSTFIDQIKAGERYDLIYLDIEMRLLNGVETAFALRTYDKNALLIYVTGHESYAKEVFEVSAFRFITKPVEEEIFAKYFHEVIKKIIDEPFYFKYKYNKIYYRVPLNEIVYFESDKRVTYIVDYKNQKSKCYIKLNNIEKDLVYKNLHFFRVHQSYLVNPKYIYMYKYDSLELNNGTKIMISEKRRKLISELYCRLKGDEIIG